MHFKFISFLNSLRNESNDALIEAVESGFLNIFESVNYPEGFDINQLKQIKSFAGRIRYVKERLQSIGKGSSRQVFKIDDDTVLKLAINKKGQSQNQTEGDYGMHSMYPDLIPELIDSDEEDDLWLVTKFANKITPKRFAELFGRSFEDYCRALIYELDGRRDGRFKMSKPEYMDELYDDYDFFQQVIDMAVNFDMPSGDLCRIGSYGELNGKIVIRDPGLTKETFKEHYRRG